MEVVSSFHVASNYPSRRVLSWHERMLQAMCMFNKESFTRRRLREIAVIFQKFERCALTYSEAPLWRITYGKEV